jgi:hypothetical protein
VILPRATAGASLTTFLGTESEIRGLTARRDRFRGATRLALALRGQAARQAKNAANSKRAARGAFLEDPS